MDQGVVREVPSDFHVPDKITIKKKEMIELGEKYGLQDERTIKCSQQLDQLLNKYINLHLKSEFVLK
ncbi:Spo0E family sporulation regulatory protein-aspartic acid phosphatase [Virgibacillus oceani]